ncbi:MAG: hypothetical protein RRY38_04015, partial [Oscillospiraceae bacterium]
KCEIDSKPANPAGESHSIEDADDNIRKAPRKRKPHKVLISVIGIAAAAAVAFSAWTYFLPKSSGATSPDLSDISAAVNEQNCAKIVLGMSKSEVDVLLGTQGLKRAPGEYVYRGETLNGRSLPIEQLLVVYGGDICEKITYLQLERASKVGAAVGPDSPIGVLPPSMTRMYSKDGTEYRETHWGYLDPFANFSKSWRGESATIVNTASGETRTRFLTGYDGADPLIISTLEGHPAGKQYTDYDEFLQDKLAFDEALLLRNRYSRGDASRVFGELEEYDAGNGITLSRIPSYERDDDGAPLYTTSVSFDTTVCFPSARSPTRVCLTKAEC